jgi:branched-chain amino acid transport system substrate-binding protein
MKHRTLNLFICIAVVGTAVAACSSASSDTPPTSSASSASGTSSATAASTSQTVKIGFIDSLTGPLAFVGVEQEQAIELAVKDINQTSKVKFQLVTKDDQSSATGAVSAMEQLLSDSSIAGVIGEDETEIGDATLPLLSSDGRPTIFLQITELPKRPANVFSVAPDTAGVAKKVADYVYSQPGITRVAFISQVQPTLTDAINTFTAEATAHGVKVVSNQQTSLTTTSFQSQITNVLSANPKAIGVSGIGPADGSIIAGLRSAGFKGIIFAQQAADSAATVQAAGNSVAGVLVGSYWDPAVGDASSGTAASISSHFTSAFEAAYPKLPPPDVNAVEAYDAAMIMNQAMSKVGTSKSAVVNALAHDSFDAGLQSPLNFGADGFANINGYVVELAASGKNKIVS